MILEIVASNMRQKTNEKRENTRYGIIEQTHTGTQYIAHEKLRSTNKKSGHVTVSAFFHLRLWKMHVTQTILLSSCLRKVQLYLPGWRAQFALCPPPPSHHFPLPWPPWSASSWVNCCSRPTVQNWLRSKFSPEHALKEEICMPNHHRLGGHLEVGHGKHLFPQAEGHFCEWPCVCLLAVLLSQPWTVPRICRRIFRMLKFVNLVDT